MAYVMQDLIRNPDLIAQHFNETAAGSLVAKRDCRIVFPETWVGRELAWVEGNVRVLAKFMLIVDNEYTICNECAYMPLSPDSVYRNTVDGVDHYELAFSKGSVVCPNLNLVVNDNVLYYIFDEFINKGRVPPYFELEDLGKLYLNSKYHSSKTLAANNTIVEMVVATIARKLGNEMTQWRHVAKDITESVKNRPAYISFKSPVYMADNTLSKISGAYFRDGLTSALVTESKTVEPLEMLVRS